MKSHVDSRSGYVTLIKNGQTGVVDSVQKKAEVEASFQAYLKSPYAPESHCLTSDLSFLSAK